MSNEPTCPNGVPNGTTPSGQPTFNICGPATVGTDVPPVPDVCLNVSGVGQMSRSLLPCDLAPVTPVPTTVAPTALVVVAASTATVASVAVRTLPQTGSTSAPAIGSAGFFLVLGLVLVAIARRSSAVGKALTIKL